MLYGLEIECGEPQGHALNYVTPIIPVCNYWEAGYDSSVQVPKEAQNDSLMYGREFRVRTPEGDLDRLCDEVVTLCKQLKSNGYRVNNTCGLHIHISGHENLQESEVLQLRTTLFALNPSLAKQIHARRRRFADDSNTKYRVVRTIELQKGHVEFRIFNGTLNGRYICQSLRLVDKVYKSIR